MYTCVHACLESRWRVHIMGWLEGGTDRVAVNNVTVQDGKDLQQSAATSEATPYTRTWTVVHAFLTWLTTFVFFIVLITAYTTEFSMDTWTPSGPGNTTFTYKLSQTFPHNLGVLRKSTWSGVDMLYTLYKDPAASIMPSTPTGNLTFSSVESTAIRNKAMMLLRCHGNVSTGTGTPLVGGITGASPSDPTVTAIGFDYSAPICSCVHDLHTTFYHRAYTSGSVTNALVKRLGDRFLGSPDATEEDDILFNITKGVDLLHSCIFAHRSPQIITSDADHVLSASPYMTVMYINAIASIACCYYIVCSRKPNDGWMYWFMFGLAVVMTIFGAVGVGVSKESIWALIMALAAHLIILGAVCVLLLLAWPGTQKGDYDKSALMRNTMDHQRLVFWLQYVLTLPAIVLLCDAMQQHKVEEYLSGRVALSVAIGFLAFGTDILFACAERMDAGHLASEIKSCATWCWYAWGVGALVLVSMSPPITASWGAVDWIPGGTTMPQVALVAYAVFMPLAFSNQAANHKSEKPWHVDASEIALANRLGVDLFARVVLTFMVMLMGRGGGGGVV